MKYCKRCVMPDTRPGIKFDKAGVCYPCLNHEKRKDIDYGKRYQELRNICDTYMRTDGHPDCIIAGSGGKDSTYQAWVMKQLGMNPLIVCVSDHYTHTDTGVHNLKNMSSLIQGDVFTFNLNFDTVRKMSRIAFEEFGSPTWAIDIAIYSIPLKMANWLNIPLVVYGENVSFEYGGSDCKETYSAKEQIKNNVVRPYGFDFWKEHGITKDEFGLIDYPDEKIVDNLEPIYLSYFVNWSGYKNYEFSRQHGFKTCDGEWDRQGFVENYDQVDSLGYIVNPWLKYPKFGHARVTDVVSNWIREGFISRNDAVELVNKYDHHLDPKALDDFCMVNGYTHKEFWDIVERFWNKDIFRKEDGRWVLKDECR